MTPIVQYLANEQLPMEKEKARIKRLCPKQLFEVCNLVSLLILLNLRPIGIKTLLLQRETF